MIAELHGKISSRGSNLSDRLEDKLTGDVFGALRYIPFHLGMAQILRAVRIAALTECVDETKLDFWGDRIRFWPKHEEGEMDAFLELDNAAISIEVKYMSGLSSDDEVENSGLASEEEREESCNQLARESRIVRQWCPPNKKPFLVFVADESECAAICNNVKSRSILQQGVELGYVSWQEILSQLCQIEASEPYHQLVLDDITSLLKRKGFERFEGFSAADNLQVSLKEFFSFDCSQSVGIKSSFTFNFDETVSGGEYYEYR